MTPNWTTVMVRELVASGEAEIKTGPFGTQLHASDYVESGTPVLNARNIGFGDIRPEKLEYISDETVQRLSAHLLKPGDIIFGRKGTVERHAFIQPKHERWFQGTDCLRLRLKGPTIDARFASYCFLTESHKQWIMNQASHGATMTSLNQDIISRIVLPSPPLPTQRKIAAILSAYDDLIEVNTRRIALLEETARGLYREWFVRFRFPGHEGVRMVESAVGVVPEGWEVKALGDVAREVRRGVQPGQIDPETPYFGLEHLPRKSIALAEWGTASQVQSTKLAFKKGEILFGKIRPYFHKVGVAPVDGVCSSDTIVIVPKTPDYFALVLGCVSSEEFVTHATTTSQGTKMPRTSWDVLVKYPVIVPPTSLLRQYNELVQDIVASILNMVFRNRNLRRTRDLLLPRLVAGEVGVGGVDMTTNRPD